MAFWERSDTALSDKEIRALKGVRLSKDEMYHAMLSAFRDRWASLDHHETYEGTFNRLCRIQGGNGYVSRFNIHPSPNTCALHLEQWVNNEAIARGFPTPRIVHVDTSRAHCQYPFQVIEYSDGIPLRGASEETTRKVLGQLGKALRQLHDKPVGDRFGRVGLGTVVEWDMFWWEGAHEHIGFCSTHGLISDDQRLDAEREFDKERALLFYEYPRLLHADLSYDNILLDPATKDLKAVIDWEDAVLGDPVFELAGLATFHPEARHASFLGAYYEDGERPDDFEYRFWIYYLRIALAKAVHRYRFGYTDAGGEGRQSADGRIALALARLNELT